MDPASHSEDYTTIQKSPRLHSYTIWELFYYRGERGKYGHRFLNISSFTTSSAALKLVTVVADEYIWNTPLSGGGGGGALPYMCILGMCHFWDPHFQPEISAPLCRAYHFHTHTPKKKSAPENHHFRVFAAPTIIVFIFKPFRRRPRPVYCGQPSASAPGFSPCRGTYLPRRGPSAPPPPPGPHSSTLHGFVLILMNTILNILNINWIFVSRKIDDWAKWVRAIIENSQAKNTCYGVYLTFWLMSFLFNNEAKIKRC